jgi:hypothetical protein
VRDQTGTTLQVNSKSSFKVFNHFNGFGTITFANPGDFFPGKFVFGMKNKKCLQPYSSAVRQITGKFENDCIEVKLIYFYFFVLTWGMFKNIQVTLNLECSVSFVNLRSPYVLNVTEGRSRKEW